MAPREKPIASLSGLIGNWKDFSSNVTEVLTLTYGDLEEGVYNHTCPGSRRDEITLLIVAEGQIFRSNRPDILNTGEPIYSPS